MENILTLEKYMNENEVLSQGPFEIRFTDINGDDQVMFLSENSDGMVLATFENDDFMLFAGLEEVFDWFPKVFSANLEYIF